MAIQAAPYLHPRLNAIATSRPMATAAAVAATSTSSKLFAVPEGRKSRKDGMVTTIDGEVLTELP